MRERERVRTRPRVGTGPTGKSRSIGKPYAGFKRSLHVSELRARETERARERERFELTFVERWWRVASDCKIAQLFLM